MYPTLISLCFMALALCSAAYGQGGFGAIAGRIIDPSGAGVPGAKIIVTNPATNLKVEAAANENGDYQVLQLLPGSYDLQVEANGFKKLSRRGIKLQVSDRITLDLTLELGEVTETVTVEAQAPLLRTQDAQTGEVINNAMIRNLPQLQRDPLRLLTLAGNVQGDGQRAEPGRDTRINGGRTVGVEYIVDGITAGTGLGHNVVSTTPTMETVAEFKVLTNGISSEYGRLSGGAVELVTKSGSNEFHGQLFEFMQNDVFNANSWFQNSQGGRKVHFTQNIFGGYVGGPISIPKLYKGQDRTFFTFNYEGTRRRQAGALQVTSVPTEAERRGDFSQTIFNGIAPVLYDQDGPVVYEAATNTYRRQLLLGDGKRIPENRIHPVSRALLQSVPLPNRAPRPGTSSNQNYAAPQSAKTDGDLWSFRIDHLLTSSHRLFGRFQTQDSFSGSTRWAGPASTANETRRDGAFGVTLNYDWTISPTFLLNVRAGGHYNPFSSGNLLPSDFSTASVPFDPITRSLLGTSNVPTVRIAGGTNIASSASLAVTNTTTYDTGLGVTKILDRHTLKFGFQHHRYFDNFFNSGGGIFSFLASPVHEIAGVDFGFGSDISIAYGTAAFLRGINNQANASGDRTRAMNLNYYAAYIQDDFKLSSKLTLNLGLRWDMDTPATDRFDKLYFWDPDAAPPFKINPGYDFNAAVRAAGLDPAAVRVPDWVRNGLPNGALRIANTPEFPSRKGTKYYPAQFAPRIGVAYQLDSKTVLRGSFAKMFISATGSAGAFSTGGEGILLADGADAGWHASTDNLVHLISNFSNPYQPDQFSRYQRTNQAANFQATSPTGPALAFNRNMRMPHEWTWSFGLQRELPKGFLVEAMYNANLGRKLLGPDIIGRFPADLFSGGPAGQNARIYTTQIDSPTAGQTLTNQVAGPKQNLAILENAFPYFGTFAVQGTNLGRSDFHALNLRAERRMAQGIALLANYTFSKSVASEPHTA